MLASSASKGLELSSPLAEVLSLQSTAASIPLLVRLGPPLQTDRLTAAEDAGKEAVNRIKAQAPHADVTYAPLDISQPDSVNAFASWAQKELGSSLRIVVNNAGEHSVADRRTLHIPNIQEPEPDPA